MLAVYPAHYTGSVSRSVHCYPPIMVAIEQAFRTSMMFDISVFFMYAPSILLPSILVSSILVSRAPVNRVPTS